MDRTHWLDTDEMALCRSMTYTMSVAADDEQPSQEMARQALYELRREVLKVLKRPVALNIEDLACTRAMDAIFTTAIERYRYVWRPRGSFARFTGSDEITVIDLQRLGSPPVLMAYVRSPERHTAWITDMPIAQVLPVSAIACSPIAYDAVTRTWIFDLETSAAQSHPEGEKR